MSRPEGRNRSSATPNHEWADVTTRKHAAQRPSGTSGNRSGSVLAMGTVHRISDRDVVVPISDVVAAMTDAEKVEAVLQAFGLNLGEPLRLNVNEYKHHLEEIAKGSKRNTMIVTCPHCEHKARIRTSRPLGPLTVQLYFVCGNAACGHTFRAHIEILATISPSACPNLAIAAQLERSARAPHATSRKDAGSASRT